MMEELITYVHRTNTLNKEGKIDTRKINELYEKNMISIYMWKDKEEKDIEDLDKLHKGEKISNISPYVNQFFNLYKDTINHNVLVYAKYYGKPSKLGLVKSDDQLIVIEDESRVFYCLKIENIKEITPSDYPLLETLIPYYSTVSKVKKGKDKLISVFYNKPLALKSENLSAKEAELLCSEWLRSECCNIDDIRIKYLKMPMGGNNAVFDILGKAVKGNKDIICQVTTSSDTQRIIKKMEALSEIMSDQISYKKVMFGEAERKEITSNDDITYISIRDVFDDFKKNKCGDFNELIDFLINR
jgi:hypothetical protein